MKTGERHAVDGTKIAYRSWEPTTPARAVVVITHGLAEHGGRYRHVAEMLAGRGYAVMIPDLRGFGVSGGRRGPLDRWDHYLDDLAVDVAAARSRRLPVVLLGHSLGGLVALSYVLEGRPAPDLLVLSAPAIAADLPLVKQVAARVLGAVMPRVSIANGLRGDQLSTDPTVGERYFADPLVHTRTTLGLGRRALTAGDACRRNLGNLAVPTLVLHGERDTIVPPAVSERLGRLPVVERVVLPGFRHEVFNENGGGPAVDRVVAWIEPRL